MELIEEALVNKFLIKYYKGFDIESILKHPKDGSDGMMVVFLIQLKKKKLNI